MISLVPALAAPLRLTAFSRVSLARGPSRCPVYVEAFDQQRLDTLKAALTTVPMLRVWDPARLATPRRRLGPALVSHRGALTELRQPSNSEAKCRPARPVVGGRRPHCGLSQPRLPAVSEDRCESEASATPVPLAAGQLGDEAPLPGETRCVLAAPRPLSET